MQPWDFDAAKNFAGKLFQEYCVNNKIPWVTVEGDFRWPLRSKISINPLEATGSPGTHEKNDFLDTLIIDFTFWALAP